MSNIMLERQPADGMSGDYITLYITLRKRRLYKMGKNGGSHLHRQTLSDTI